MPGKIICFLVFISGYEDKLFRYLAMTNCDLQVVGNEEDEFSKKPYALAVQKGSPLKDQLNDA